MKIFSGNPRKVIVSMSEVAAFNRQWPCSELSDARAYWFEFDASGDLVDCDMPEHSDGAAAAALCEDVKAFLEDDTIAERL